MRVRRPVVTGWVLLAAGGWAATLWLGEPSATAGPGPAPASGVRKDNPEPGPQPEGSCPTPGATASPPASTDPSLLTKVPGEYRDGYATQVDCYYAVLR
ncbi:hypothetical protein [Streptomyces sp. HB132]|uniref:hypothetical protein n=1 Tax=Streptomyces sp. HB132 TaxID=767388 RepID=UPI00195FD421|nr:hypothetical protein [Streptomyces sp. HB132]MBM7437229.1 hypothetical protein [Streptomyces sp. HB132]